PHAHERHKRAAEKPKKNPEGGAQSEGGRPPRAIVAHRAPKPRLNAWSAIDQPPPADVLVPGRGGHRHRLHGKGSLLLLGGLPRIMRVPLSARDAAIV